MNVFSKKYEVCERSIEPVVSVCDVEWGVSQCTAGWSLEARCKGLLWQRGGGPGWPLGLSSFLGSFVLKHVVSPSCLQPPRVRAERTGVSQRAQQSSGGR